MGTYLWPLLGGVLIGVASWIMLAGLGRISGVSSIASDVVTAPVSASGWRWAFLMGLVGAGTVFAGLSGVPEMLPRSPWMLIPAGLLVGVGTVLGSGCTSGHGVCGLGRRSIRSLVAVCVFMAAGFATVFIAGGAIR